MFASYDLKKQWKEPLCNFPKLLKVLYSSDPVLVLIIDYSKVLLVFSIVFLQVIFFFKTSSGNACFNLFISPLGSHFEPCDMIHFRKKVGCRGVVRTPPQTSQMEFHNKALHLRCLWRFRLILWAVHECSKC